jgi:ATP-dependent Clp protease ATP-binding subunit ClpC
MFERYTEKARRVIFFARYEVSELGSKSIEPEHLLLGLLREDKALIARFLPANVSTEMIRDQVEASVSKRERIPTSVEIPLSRMSKRVLKYAQEESETLKHRDVGTEDLLLGLLRQKNSRLHLGSKKELVADRVLRENGLELAEVRQQIKCEVDKE